MTEYAPADFEERYKICPITQKRGYGSQRAARAAHASAGFRVKAYLCDRCLKWHIANADGKAK